MLLKCMIWLSMHVYAYAHRDSENYKHAHPTVYMCICLHEAIVLIIHNVGHTCVCLHHTMY